MKQGKLGLWVAVWVLLQIFPVNAMASESLKPVNLRIFSAPWCLFCRAKLPGLLKKIDDELGPHLGQDLSVSLYIETGAAPFTTPTEEAATAFAAHLGTQFPVLPDPGWATYKQYYSRFFLPGAVVLDGQGKPLKVFGSALGLNPDDIVDYLVGSFNQH